MIAKNIQTNLKPNSSCFGKKKDNVDKTIGTLVGEKKRSTESVQKSVTKRQFRAHRY